MLRVFLSVFLCYGTVVKADAPDTKVFNLKQTILFAISHSPAFDSITRQLSIARLEEKSADARILPSVDLTATHGILDSSPKSTISPWHSQFNLGLTETLYDNGIIQSNRRISSLNRQQAELNFKDQKNKVSLNIVNAYLRYSLNFKLAEIQEKQFLLVNRQFDLISKDYHQGMKTKKDFFRFKTQVSRSEIDLLSTKSAVEKSKQELQGLVGMGLLEKVDVNFIPIRLEELKTDIAFHHFNIEDHLLYKSAQIQKESSQIIAEQVARKNYPELYLSAGIDYSSSNYVDTNQSFNDNDKVGWNALLTIKYNILDWGIRSRNAAVANEKSRLQSNQLDSELLALKTSLNQLKLDLDKYKKNFLLAKELLSLERSNITYIEREYRTGRVQYLDLILGLNNLSDSEIKFYSALSDVQSNHYIQLYHQGKLYEELIK